jgi:hypothetical protein
LIIRWGPEASSNRLRQSARCAQFGRKGVTLQHPSWRGSAVGWEAFPVLPMPEATPWIRPVAIFEKIRQDHPEIRQGVRRTLERRIRPRVAQTEN